MTYCCLQKRFKLFKSKSFEKAGRGRILSKEGRAGFGEETIWKGVPGEPWELSEVVGESK